MDIDVEIVTSTIVLLSAGLGLTFGLKFFKWVTSLTSLSELKWVINKPFVRLTFWLILGSMFAKPFMDLSSLLIEFAKISYMVTQPVSERSLPVGWEISHYSLYVGIRLLLFGMSYGYAIWAVPKILSMLALEKGISINSRGFEGVCIALTCGSLMHALIASVAFGIQQLPIPALLGNEDSTAGFFTGWLIAFILLPVIMYSLNTIVNKTFKSKPRLGTSLS